MRRVDAATGVIQTIAGKSNAPASSTDLTADGRQAMTVQLGIIAGMAVDASTNIFIATGGAIAKVSPDGVFHLLAGPRDGRNGVFAGAKALATRVGPGALAIDDKDNMFFSDSSTTTFPHGIWTFGSDGILHVVTTKLVPNSLTWASGALLGTYFDYVYAITQDNIQTVAGVNPQLFSPLGSAYALALDNSGFQIQIVQSLAPQQRFNVPQDFSGEEAVERGFF